MSDLIVFDPENATATISLVGWPEPLAALLRLIPTVEEGILRLNYSGLSNELDSSRARWQTDRYAFIAGLRDAAKVGRLDLINALLERADQLQGWNEIDIDGRHAALRATRPGDIIAQNIAEMRDMVATEAKLGSPWLKTAMNGLYRQHVLDERGLVDALHAQVRDAASFREAIGLFRPQDQGDAGEWDRLIADHWVLTQAFITAHVPKAAHYLADPELDLLGALFSHSVAVQSSRWACEQVLTHAPPSTLGDLLSHSIQLTADDVRALQHRLRNADKTSLRELQPAVQKAFTAFGSRSIPMPVDVVLAGLHLGLDFPAGAMPTAAQRAIFDRVSELPKEQYESDGLWRQLGIEQQAEWRNELAALVEGGTDLAEGLIGFACTWLERVGYVEIEPVLRRLINDEGPLAFVQSLVEQGPRLVKLRASALTRAKLEADTDAVVAIEGLPEPLPDVGAATWLSDPAAERTIHGAMAAVEAEFCREYRSIWGSEEEFLTAELLIKARAAANEATQQLRQLRQTTKGRFPSISLDVRQPGKWEEGKKTSAGAPLGADILFLTRLEDAGVTLAERATFVQVKKRKRGKTEKFSTVIGVDSEQCDHLLAQTEHAFYLFLVPASPHPKLWVTPARLVRNLSQLHISRSSIPAIQARDSSISFADFFLHHLVGLWSGDERTDVLKAAKGDPARGRPARLIVEVVVRRSEA